MIYWKNNFYVKTPENTNLLHDLSFFLDTSLAGQAYGLGAIGFTFLGPLVLDGWVNV